MIRYKIRSDVTYFTLDRDLDGKNTIELTFRHDQNYFVDILERDTKGISLAKYKIYMPDGNVHIGWQMVWHLEIYHTDGDPFDGRFNLK